LNFALESGHPANSKEVSALGSEVDVAARRYNVCLAHGSGRYRKASQGSRQSNLMAWSAANARVKPKGNAIVMTKQASGSAKIDPLMAAFNAIAWMAANPASSQPSIFVT
jgi:hypothetical protein